MEIRRIVIKPDIRDVAREAGVSLSTVSNVMNGLAIERRTSSATARKVIDVAHGIGYYGGDETSRSLRGGHKNGPKITDVAREAQLAVSTVSEALRGRGAISIETSERVKLIAERMNYAPSKQAQRVRMGFIVYTSRNP